MNQKIEKIIERLQHAENCIEQLHHTDMCVCGVSDLWKFLQDVDTILTLTIETRKKQREFFATRDQRVLVVSKELERELDSQLTNVQWGDGLFV